MTVGYPDYARRSEANVLPLISFSQVVNGQTLTAYEYVGDIPYLEIAWDTTGLGDNYQIQLSWSDDDQGNTFSGYSQITAGPSMTGWVSFKSKGRYVQLIVGNKQNVDVSPITIYVRGSDTPPGPYDSGYQAAPLLLYNASVSASSSHTENAVTVIGGRATIYLHHATNASWNASIDYWDYVGAQWLTFGQWDGSEFGTGGSWPIVLPMAPVRVKLTNSDTSGRTMIAAITT